MRRRFLVISSICISMLSFLFFNKRVHEANDFASTTIKVAKSLDQKRTTKLPKVSSNSIISVSPPEDSYFDINSDRDYLLWRKTSDELEEAWNNELQHHIQYVDREGAEELYKSYLKERKNYLDPQETSLSDALNDISRLSGESIVSANEYIEPEMHQDEFITNLRRIFRNHYGFIETQRKIFLDAHTDY